MLGECYNHQDNREESQQNYLNAWTADPTHFQSFKNYLKVKKYSDTELLEMLNDLDFPE